MKKKSDVSRRRTNSASRGIDRNARISRDVICIDLPEKSLRNEEKSKLSDVKTSEQGRLKKFEKPCKEFGKNVDCDRDERAKISGGVMCIDFAEDSFQEKEKPIRNKLKISEGIRLQKSARNSVERPVNSTKFDTDLYSSNVKTERAKFDPCPAPSGEIGSKSRSMLDQRNFTKIFPSNSNQAKQILATKSFGKMDCSPSASFSFSNRSFREQKTDIVERKKHLSESPVKISELGGSAEREDLTTSKKMKLKLKRLDKKRVSIFGSTGISPVKKKQVKDGGLEQKVKPVDSYKRSLQFSDGPDEDILSGYRMSNNKGAVNDSWETSGENDCLDRKRELKTRGKHGNELPSKHSPSNCLNKNLENLSGYGVENSKGPRSDPCTELPSKHSPSNCLNKDVDNLSGYAVKNSKGPRSDPCTTPCSSTDIPETSLKDESSKMNDCSFGNLDDSFEMSFGDKIDANLNNINQSLLDISFGEDFDPADVICNDAGHPSETAVKSLLVLEVTKQEYLTAKFGSQTEKSLRLFDEKRSTEATCILRQDWQGMDIFPGDTIHITGLLFNFFI